MRAPEVGGAFLFVSKMVLAHRAVAGYLLAERADLLQSLLRALAFLQGMNAYRKKVCG